MTREEAIKRKDKLYDVPFDYSGDALINEIFNDFESEKKELLEKSCEYWRGVFNRDDYGLGVHTEKAIERYLKAMEE